MAIVPGTHGGATLCQKCAAGIAIDFDEDSGHFSYEELGPTPTPTAAPQSEADGPVCLNSRVEWQDESPDFPALMASYDAGCELCGFVRDALMRRNIGYRGEVDILGRYLFGVSKQFVGDGQEDRDGVTYWSCQVIAEKSTLGFVAFRVGTMQGILFTRLTHTPPQVILRIVQKRLPRG
jgi:hypothetical protein